jgi:hypothetical protein
MAMCRSTGEASGRLLIIRRTLATLTQDAASPQNIQDVMRHERLATTTEVYPQQSETRYAPPSI